MNGEKVILFDLGRVVIDFNHLIAVERIKDYCKLKKEDIFSLFFDSDFTDRYERGLITSEDFFKEVKDMLKADITYDEFIPVWTEIFFPVPGMLEILKSLHETYKLYMVSNVNELHFLYVKNKFPQYFKYFSHVFLSYELHLRKPDKKIYQHIIDYIKLPPQNIIYTDDRDELVDAAKKLGIDAFVFRSLDLFKEELTKRNVKFEMTSHQASFPNS